MLDFYKMFVNLRMEKRGVDCDDVYSTMRDCLELPITKDEVFIVFYRGDKDEDSYWSYSELRELVCPRDYQYQTLFESRPAFYGALTSPKVYFEGNTRECLK